MQTEFFIESDEAYAFEQGYRLNFKYGDDLINARLGIRQNIALAQTYNLRGRDNVSLQRYEGEWQANLRNYAAFLAGKTARLKDKPDVFLLEQRQAEYIEEKTKAEEQNKGKIIDELIKFIFGSRCDIVDTKDKIKKIAKWSAYVGAIFLGGMGIAVCGVGAHFRGSLEGLQLPFYSCTTMMLTGTAAVCVEKLNDEIMNHKIYTRREADKRREQGESKVRTVIAKSQLPIIQKDPEDPKRRKLREKIREGFEAMGLYPTYEEEDLLIEAYQTHEAEERLIFSERRKLKEIKALTFEETNAKLAQLNELNRRECDSHKKMNDTVKRIQAQIAARQDAIRRGRQFTKGDE